MFKELSKHLEEMDKELDLIEEQRNNLINNEDRKELITKAKELEEKVLNNNNIVSDISSELNSMLNELDDLLI